MKKSNNQGFSIVAILLVIVIVGLIGAVGWLVYDRQQNKTSKQTNTKTSEQLKQETPKQESTTQEQKYLEIKEEGIKLKISDVISDVYYTTEGGINFGVHSLDNVSGCKLHKVNYGGPDFWKAVARLSFDKYATGFRTDQAPEASGFKNNPNAVRVGDNWYAIDTDDPPTDCSSTDSTTQAKIKAVQDAFKEASKTITKL